jgi:hypothetical protein
MGLSSINGSFYHSYGRRLSIGPAREPTGSACSVSAKRVSTNFLKRRIFSKSPTRAGGGARCAALGLVTRRNRRAPQQGSSFRLRRANPSQDVIPQHARQRREGRWVSSARRHSLPAPRHACRSSWPVWRPSLPPFRARAGKAKTVVKSMGLAGTHSYLKEEQVRPPSCAAQRCRDAAPRLPLPRAASLAPRRRPTRPRPRPPPSRRRRFASTSTTR